MRIRELLPVESLELNGVVKDKTDALNQLVDLMVKSGKIIDVDVYREGVLACEQKEEPYIWHGVVFLHCASETVSRPGFAAMVIKHGVEFGIANKSPVYLLFLSAAPQKRDDVYQEAVDRLSDLLAEESFTAALRNAKGTMEFLSIVDDAEGIKTGVTSKELPKEHGAEKPLTTSKEDKEREIEAISEALCREAASACMREMPTAHTQNAAVREKKSPAFKNAGYRFLTHLLSGISHMLPFAVCGAIMLALAALFETWFVSDMISRTIPESSVQFSDFLRYVGGLMLGLIVPVLAGYIACSIAERPGLVVGFTGGLLAINGNIAASGNTAWGIFGGLVAGFFAGYIVLLLKKLTAKLPRIFDGINATVIYPLIGIFCVAFLMGFVFNRRL